MKLFCLILTTKKYTDRIKAVSDTWAKDFDHLFYSDHEDLQNNIIKTDDKNGYHQTSYKQTNLLNLLKDNYRNIINDYDWIFLGDDDTFLNRKAVYNNIQYLDKNAVHGFILSRNNNSDNPIFSQSYIPQDFSYLSGGAGHFLNTDLLNKIDKFTVLGIENTDCDVSFGLNLYKKKIPIINNKLMHSEKHTSCNHDVEEINKNITYHHVSPIEMSYLYDITR